MSFDDLASGWAKSLGVDRKQFNMFFNKMLDGFAYHKIVIDKAGKPVDYVFLEINHPFEIMTGLKRERIIGKKVTEVLPGIEKDPADWIGVYGKVALSGEQVQFENHAEPLGKWYKVSAYCPEKGFFVALFEDITDRKKIEDALRESEERFRSVLNNSLDVVYRFNLQSGQYEYMSPAIRTMGFEPEEMTEMSNAEVFSRVHPEDLPTLKLDLNRISEKGKGVSEYRFLGKDGVYRWWSNQMVISQDKNGKPLYRDGYVRDITERKKAEEELRASEKKANDLIKHAPSGIYELDYRIPPRFRSVNDAMCQILGYSREELLATSPFALLDDESKMRFRERIMKMLAGEKVNETAEFRVIPKDGREIYAVINTTFTYKDGKPDGALVIAHDVTERRKAEKELEKRAKDLESLVEERTKALRDSERLAAIGATAGMVGHDIRNPLQAITSDVYLAKIELASTADTEEKRNALESLEEIEKNVVYINKIVADLQDYARPIKPVNKEADLETVVKGLLLTNGMPENIKVSTCLEKDAQRVLVDPDLLKRILGNLITNAVQAMPDGGELAIRSSQDSGDVVITVQDTGVGIPESAKSKLFTPLFTTKSKGQGFGLAVVKRMTEALNGTVTFDSQEGKGTKFIIRLPSLKD